MFSEFDIIQRYFTRPAPSAVLGVGDDAAVIKPSPGMELAISTDMLLSGRHFFADADPLGVGHKSLAVNLSDMAAMGAKPRWATLSLALPAELARENDKWLKAFSEGFFKLALPVGQCQGCTPQLARYPDIVPRPRTAPAQCFAFRHFANDGHANC